MTSRGGQRDVTGPTFPGRPGSRLEVTSGRIRGRAAAGRAACGERSLRPSRWVPGGRRRGRGPSPEPQGPRLRRFSPRFSPRRRGHGGLHAERAHARRSRRRGRGKQQPPARAWPPLRAASVGACWRRAAARGWLG